MKPYMIDENQRNTGVGNVFLKIYIGLLKSMAGHSSLLCADLEAYSVVR